MQSGTAGHDWIRVHIGKQLRAAGGDGQGLRNAAHSQIVFWQDRQMSGRKQRFIVAMPIESHLFVADRNAVADKEICAELLVAALATIRKILRTKQNSGFPAVTAFVQAEVRLDFRIRESQFSGLLVPALHGRGQCLFLYGVQRVEADAAVLHAGNLHIMQSGGARQAEGRNISCLALRHDFFAIDVQPRRCSALSVSAAIFLKKFQ